MVKSPDVYVSTAAFKQLNTLPLALDRLASANILNVELSGGLQHYDGDIAAMLKERSRQASFKYVIHNYFPVPEKSFVLNIASTDSDLWEQSNRFCENSLRVAAEIGSPVYGIHAGYCGSLKDRGDGYFILEEDSVPKTWKDEVEKSYQMLLRSAERLAPLARRLGVKMCIENLAPVKDLPPQLFTTIAEWQRFFKDTNGSNIGFLLDFAHLKITEVLGGQNFDTALRWALSEGRDKLFQVHLSGTDGNWDSHVKIRENDWLIRSLKKWSDNTGWPNAPVSYESRSLTLRHLNKILPVIKSNMRCSPD